MAIHKLENYLKTYRKRAGLSQKEVDYLLGVHVGSTTTRYEHFERIPTLEKALACEALFDAPVRELFAGMYLKAQRRTVRRARLLRKKLVLRGPVRSRKLTLLDHLVGDDNHDHLA